jgi:hypothetical protein
LLRYIKRRHRSQGPKVNRDTNKKSIQKPRSGKALQALLPNQPSETEVKGKDCSPIGLKRVR